MFQKLTEEEKLYIINSIIDCLSELLFKEPNIDKEGNIVYNE
jgi:hypothetical protein